MISSSMNLVMTVLGFAVSATFIVFVCARLLCARAVRRRRRREALAAAPGFQSASSMERSLSGLEPSVVAKLPTLKYNQRIFSSREDALCTVCLTDYAEKEVLRLLPWCGHAFHIDCIDPWLRQHSTCPICRLSLRDSPDRRINYSQINPQIAPAMRSLFSPEIELSNEIEIQSDQQQQQELDQQQRWNPPGRWSLKLWRRSERGDDQDQDRTVRRDPSSQDSSSVTININIGQIPRHDESGAANNRDNDGIRSNDLSISLGSPRRENDGDDAAEQQRESNSDSNHRSRPVNLSIELNVCDNGIFGYSAARS